MLRVKKRKITQFGEFWVLGSIFGFGGANFFDRMAVINVDPLVGPVVKNLPSLVFSIFLLYTRDTFKELLPSSDRYIGRAVIWLFLLSGMAAAGGLLFYFYAIYIGGLVITPAFLQTQILWATLFGWIFLRERFNRYALMGLVLTVLGLMTLSYGQSLEKAVSPQWYLAIPLALLAGAFYAAAGALTREGQLQGADQSSGMFLRFAASTLLATLALLVSARIDGLWRSSWSDLGALLLSGTLSGPLAIYCFFICLRLMSVGRTFALNGLNPIVAAGLGYLFLGEYINLTMVIGILSACAGVGIVQLFKPSEERKA